jgi:polyhydroxybutyrate depolymerase
MKRILRNVALVAASLLALPQFSLAETPLLKEFVLQNGDLRSFLFYAPPVASAQKLPLVIVLHGGGGNGENAANMTGFTAKAAQEGFAVAYPNGSGKLKNSLLTWNANHCCGYAMENDVDDVQFIAKVINKLTAEYAIDGNRVYVTGMSNGAMMSHRIGIELAHKVAAIAPVAGTLFGDEVMPQVPVSALFINGALDESVPPEGGAPGGIGASAWDGTPTKPAAYQGFFWARADQCRLLPDKTTSADGLVTRWDFNCPAGTDVVRYLIADNGHAWPGGEQGSRRGDEPSQAINATDVIWDFFKDKSR